MENFLVLGAIDPIAIVVTCLIGAVCGFLAGQLMKGGGFGLVGNIIVGIIGAALFATLFGSLNLVDIPFVNEIAGGTIGSCILLFVIGLFKKATSK